MTLLEKNVDVLLNIPSLMRRFVEWLSSARGRTVADVVS
jgi:hypothetical protein